MEAPICTTCRYDDRMSGLPGYPERYLIGYCAEHGRQRAATVYVDDDPAPRRAYRDGFYGYMVEVGDGAWLHYPNARVDTRPLEDRHRGSFVPMVADVLRTMRDEGVDQDETVRRLGGTP